jgi:S1-C subfamily serine protease
MYLAGEGTLTDPTQGITWLIKAAERGLANAQYTLGQIYIYSVGGVTKDLGKAKYWIKKAYKSNDANIVKDAKKLWEDAELWKYKSKKDSGSSTTNKTPKQKEHYSSSGTGFRVDKKGMLITNYHVVKGCSDVKVNGNKVVVKSTDSRNDLALLQGSPSSLIPYFRAGRSVRLGDDIIITGYPLRSVLGSGLNVTTGTVASLSGLGNNTSRMQITAPINSGNSGGPVFDNSGRIVGVVVSKINTTKAREILGEDIQGANFAIKGSVVRSFLDMNDVDYEVSTSNKNRSTADIIEDAKGFTIFVECWK